MKNVVKIFLICTLMVAGVLTSCSRQMEKRNKKAQVTDNKTEGYLYYQKDQTLKGDSGTVIKAGNN